METTLRKKPSKIPPQYKEGLKGNFFYIVGRDYVHAISIFGIVEVKQFYYEDDSSRVNFKTISGFWYCTKACTFEELLEAVENANHRYR